MPRRSLLLLLALLAVFLLCVGWFVCFPKVRAPVGEDAAVRDRNVEGAATTNPPVELASPDVAPPAASRANTPLPASSDALRTSLDSADAELADAVWITGRVIVPDGTPPDEHVEIVADGAKFAKRPLYRTVPAPDGSFRVAFNRSTELGVVSFEARYLYLDASPTIWFASPPKEVVLRPRLGGRLEGRIVFNGNGASIAAKLAGGVIEAAGHIESMTDTSAPVVTRLATTSEELRFEFAGLPEELVYEIRAPATGRSGPRRSGVRVRAGESTSIVLNVGPGARISGTVVDADGRASAGAWVQASSTDANGTIDDGDTLRTDADGRFEFPAVRQGRITLIAHGRDSASATLDLGELADTSIVRDVKIAFARTFSISGRVLWPDGRPAAGGKVEYVGTREFAGAQVSVPVEVDTGMEGEFELSGLGEEPVDLTASAATRRSTVPAKSDPDAASGPASFDWVAFAEDVKPGTSGLVLRLAPGSSTQGRVVDEAGNPIGNARVRANTKSGLEDEWVGHPSSPTATSRGDGLFELEGLHEGTWMLVATAEGHAESSPKSISVPGDASIGTLVLRQPATVAGTVVDPAGRAVAGACVSVLVREPESSKARRGHLSALELTGVQGEFVLKSVTPGSVLVQAWGLDGARSEPVPVDLVPGQSVVGLNLVLGSATGTARDKK
jgi:hypothetical protein